MPRSEDLGFRAGDVTLDGTLLLPDGDGPHPWAVLVPSWLPRGRDGDWDRIGHPAWFAALPAHAPPGLFDRLAHALVARNVATLRFDPRGCGTSGGDWAAADLFARIDDVRDAVGAMRSRSELDLRRSALIGHGEGCGIALSVAIGDPAIGAVGLIGASARSFRDVLRRGVAERACSGEDRQHPVVAALDAHAEELIERVERREATTVLQVGTERVELALRGWEQAFHTPPLALATMLHRNVVLAHGASDAWSDQDESRILAGVLAAAGNEPVLQLVPDSGHDLASDEAVANFVEAFAERIVPRDLPPVLLAIEEMR